MSTTPTPPAGNPFFLLCDKTAARELMDPTRKLITVPHDMALLNVLNLLTTSHISSAPVLDANQQLLGSVDFLSLLQYVTLQSQRDDPVDITTEPISSVLSHCSTSSTLVPYFVDNPVSQLIDIMIKAKRVALYSKGFELLTTLSQSDVVRFLISILEDIKAGKPSTTRYANDIMALANTPLKDLGLLKAPHSLASTATLYDALVLCSANHFRVLSVINPTDGALIGDFRVGKLSSLHGNYDRIKQLTLLDWILTIDNDKNAPQDVPCIASDATYLQALYLMISCKTHHLWVVSEDKKPLFVCTMTDLLRVLKTTDVDLDKVNLDGLDLHQLWKA